ncbi:uncharacterized protein A4U43_C10F9420 [Asparagus officinalis]|uniref:Methyltransferase domain-containing protein n=1 Tax=Asparagus officinalis TaxID=4686 RepID=A0A5P1E1L2_ASPOF|nr:uncharacterized protein A4U43_C10F9420 [Asparagus officinalis]
MGMFTNNNSFEGYDVVAMASPDRHVLGLDISSTAVKKANEWSSSLPNANYFNFLAADFFTWQPMELFDMVFEYTFFPAIDPCMRPSWAKKMADILKPDGDCHRPLHEAILGKENG